jgi:hypothetical protein
MWPGAALEGQGQLRIDVHLGRKRQGDRGERQRKIFGKEEGGGEDVVGKIGKDRNRDDRRARQRGACGEGFVLPLGWNITALMFLEWTISRLMPCRYPLPCLPRERERGGERGRGRRRK